MMLCSFGNFITLFLYYYLYLYKKEIYSVCDKIACCDFLIIYGKQKIFKAIWISGLKIMFLMKSITEILL